MAQDDLFRTAIGILRTNRSLSREFRDWLIGAMEGLDQAKTEIEMVESLHHQTGSPFASTALDTIRTLNKI